MGDAAQILQRNLDVFNSSAVHLIELVNTNWRHSPQDLQLSSLQNQVDCMRDLVLRVIKSKSENIVENIIPAYFDRLLEVECSPSSFKKRKLVSFEDAASSSSIPVPFVDTLQSTQVNPFSLEALFASPTDLSSIWSESEELLLRELVSRYKSGSKGKRVVEWSSVARELRRNELDCKVKWNALCNAARTRKGPYKVEEDQLIIAKVQEYLTASGASSSSSGSNSGNSNSSGDSSGVSSELWEGLEKTMGRPAKNIRLRWKITLSKLVDNISCSIADPENSGGIVEGCEDADSCCSSGSE